MNHADELTILIKHTQNVLLQLLLITNTEKKRKQKQRREGRAIESEVQAPLKNKKLLKNATER